MNSAYLKPLPDVEDPRSAEHWTAARQGRLAMQRCPACGYLRWPPGLHCPECLTEGGRWEVVPPHGHIHSFSTYRHAYHPGFAPDLPYDVALVELTAGPRIVGTLVDSDRRPTIGDKVAAIFLPVTEKVTLIGFRVIPLGQSVAPS